MAWGVRYEKRTMAKCPDLEKIYQSISKSAVFNLLNIWTISQKPARQVFAWVLVQPESGRSWRL